MYCTAWEVSKCGDFSGPYFSVLSPNTEKYRPEKMPYLGTFHAVIGKDMFFVYSKHLWCGKILQNWRSMLLKLFQVKITHRYFNNAEAVSKDLLNLPYILQKNMVNTTTQLRSTKPELRLKSCLGHVWDSRWWESLTLVPAGNKTTRFLSVNHVTKAIHNHHHHYHYYHHHHHHCSILDIPKNDYDS